MDACWDPNIPTKVVNKRNIRCLVFLIVFWSIGFLFPFIFRPTSYLRMNEMERKVFPPSKKFKIHSHILSHEIYEYLEKYIKFYEHKAEMFKLSLPTFEGRDIKMVHIKVPSYYGNVHRGRILVLAGMSACIWDSVMSSIDLIHKLCEECSYKYPYSMDYEWYILPIFNPDGYDYTLKLRNIVTKLDKVKDPRNRFTKTPMSGCGPISLDRNFGFHWGESKHRDYNNSCWMGYAGLFPFSENETKSIETFIEAQYDIKEPITMYLQLHGHEGRDDITFPWRYTKRRPSNYQVLNTMAKTAAKAVNDEMGYHFTYSQSGHRDRASGVMSDWLMGTRHVTYVFIIQPWYLVANESTIPEPQLYIEKAIRIVFSLVKSSRDLHIAHQEQEYII